MFLSVGLELLLYGVKQICVVACLHYLKPTECVGVWGLRFDSCFQQRCFSSSYGKRKSYYDDTYKSHIIRVCISCSMFFAN